MDCLTDAWIAHAAELRGWAARRLDSSAATDDFLQDLFLKALRQGERFCAIENARAWLFEVARNTLADRLRVKRETVELPDDLATPLQDIDTVDELTRCLPRVLSELAEDDRDAINLCDLQGMAQADFAKLKGLSLSGAKSRLQRARERLRLQMTSACQVKLGHSGGVEDFVPRSTTIF
jgi:RNA polymerase sigma-70 factor (ECF subfamily)